MTFGLYLNDMRDAVVLKRYQNKFMHKKRSIAEHMCSTAMISQWLVIIEKELFNNDNVDMAEVLQRAINYNTTQIFTGNIVASAINLTPAMKDAMKAMKKLAYEDYIEPKIPKEYVNDFRRFTVDAKDDSIEGKIVLAADWIDTILECVEEIKLNNKVPFEDILIKSAKGVSEINLPSVRYMLKYIIPKFGIDIDSYGKEFRKYIHSVHFECEDDSKFKSFDVIGDYVYQYRALMSLLRYQNKFMFKRTSVVEHMWFVAKISQVLSLWMNDKYNTSVDIGKVICIALGHDMSEFVTGDILSTTKRMTTLMKKAVDEMEKVAFDEYIKPIIPESVLEDYEAYILHPKEGGVEGKILAAADIIDTIYECAGEIKLGNVELFLPILQKVTNTLLDIELEAVDYFLINSLKDIGLDIKEFYGDRVYEHIEKIKNK